MKRRSLHRVVWTVALSVAAVQLSAESKLWIGGNGGDWNVAENWQPSGVPAKEDTAVFRSEGTVQVELSALPLGISGLRFERGTTILHTTSERVDGSSAGTPLRMPAGENVLFAADGATGIISNVLNGATGATLAKEGHGEIIAALSFGTGYGYFDSIDVRAGTLSTHSAMSVIYCLQSVVYVRSGATLRTERENSVHPSFAVQVDKGGTWDFGGAKQSFAAIKGDGVLTNFPDGYELPTSAVLDDFTGRFVVSAGKNASVSSASEKSFPFAFETVAADESTAGTISAGWILFKNTTSLLTLDRLLGNGTFSFAGLTVISQASTSGAMFWLNAGAEVSISGGEALLSGDQLKFRAGSKLVVENGAYVGKSPEAPKYGGWTTAKRPAGVDTVDQAASGSIEIRDGGTFFGSFGGVKTNQVSLGGTLMLGAGLVAQSGATAEDPALLTVDGGTLALHTEKTPYEFKVTPDSDALRVTVGSGGMSLDCDMETLPYSEGTHEFVFRRPIFGEGGIVRTGGGILYGTHPWQIAGAFDNRDGTVEIHPEAEGIAASSAPLFGTGDFRLGNARLQFRGDSAATPAMTAKVGTGGSFIYDGAASVRTSRAAGLPRHGLELGALQRGGAGAALFFWNASGTEYNASCGKVTFSESPAADAAGRVAGPVFTFDKPTDWNYGRIGFAAYGTDGLVSYAGYTDGVAGGADSIALVTGGTKATVASAVSVAALRVDGDKSVPSSGDGAAASMLQILSGGRLCVGGESDATGCVILNNRHSGDSPATIKGAGVLDFGSREGVIAVNGKSGGAVSFARVDAKISGSGGLSVVGLNDITRESGLELRGANDYTGGTRVNGAFVRPTTAASLSSGDVWLGDGELCGGALQLDTVGLVVPNRIHAAGWGPCLLGELTGRGALVFKKSATLSGDVDAYRPLRIGALDDASVEGVFTGCISGGKIQVWSAQAGSPTAGAIVFMGANTYAGGTEVVNATLVLRNGGTAGTGPIWLSGGTLVVDGAEPQTIPNRMTGVGTIRICGKGEKTFAALEGQDNAGFTLDLGTARRLFVSSLKGISSITSSRAGGVELWVSNAAEQGSFTGDVAQNVTICYGERGTPGMVLIVR